MSSKYSLNWIIRVLLLIQNLFVTKALLLGQCSGFCHDAWELQAPRLESTELALNLPSCFTQNSVIPQSTEGCMVPLLRSQKMDRVCTTLETTQRAIMLPPIPQRIEQESTIGQSTKSKRTNKNVMKPEYAPRSINSQKSFENMNQDVVTQELSITPKISPASSEKTDKDSIKLQPTEGPMVPSPGSETKTQEDIFFGAKRRKIKLDVLCIQEKRKSGGILGPQGTLNRINSLRWEKVAELVEPGIKMDVLEILKEELTNDRYYREFTHRLEHLKAWPPRIPQKTTDKNVGTEIDEKFKTFGKVAVLNYYAKEQAREYLDSNKLKTWLEERAEAFEGLLKQLKEEIVRIKHDHMIRFSRRRKFPKIWKYCFLKENVKEEINQEFKKIESLAVEIDAAKRNMKTIKPKFEELLNELALKIENMKMDIVRSQEKVLALISKTSA